MLVTLNKTSITLNQSVLLEIVHNVYVVVELIKYLWIIILLERCVNSNFRKNIIENNPVKSVNALWYVRCNVVWKSLLLVSSLTVLFIK